jgi:excisionase family DNA binding protein
MGKLNKRLLDQLKREIIDYLGAVPKPRTMNITQCATYLGVSVPGVRHWVRTAGLPAYRFGSGPRARLMFKLEDVDAWISGRQKRAAASTYLCE